MSKKTNKIVCPKCTKPSYTTATEIYGPCPYCNHIFYWNSTERRDFERKNNENPIILKFNKQVFTAEIRDISKGGIGVIIPGPNLVKKGDQIRCIFGESDEMRNTKVVWTEVVDDNQRVGLLFI